MEKKFREEYKKLNAEQRRAVDTIDGPVLVVAGPGTGKTQLLSIRVANILHQGAVEPNNILCLTFTDNAARNMRERLETIIGQSAYHVAIHTFHSFGSDIFNQYPDFFTSRQLLQQVDELGLYELLRAIFEQLPHSNPLSVKVGEEFIYIKDILDAISWLKQNALSPVELHEIINANEKFMESVNEDLAKVFDTTPSSKQINVYRDLETLFRKQATGKRLFGFPEYASECAAELSAAIDATTAESRFAPKITAWRNAWCQKDASGKHVFKDSGRNMRKMHAVANVYQELVDEMSSQGLYDFDDMVIEAVHAIEANSELRMNLQERYQYILVDEFQDTNKAQLRMLIALGDNPIFEGKPNIMAVGDDDQAIYTFQGALVSNITAFAQLYRSPQIITLKENYRSSANILDTSFTVADQITDRLESALPEVHKNLSAKASYDNQELAYTVFSSELAQYDWIAGRVQEYIKSGIRPENIAVIAPRHRYLERLVPYLGDRKLPVAYERRENILEAPIIIKLLAMAKLVVAISENRHDDIDALISEVLSFDFWEIPAETLLKLSLDTYKSNQHWLAVLSKHKNKYLKNLAHWFIGLARHSHSEPMEYMLDELLGVKISGQDSEFDDIGLQSNTAKFTSPMQAYFFSPKRYEHATDSYLTLLGQLSTLRQRLREWKPNQTLYINDLVEFADLHAQANLKIIDTNPHTQTTNAVQVMTAYKAKGLEFDVVFVINAQDEIWGPTARSRSSNISLPKNLPIAPARDTDNDKLRLLFVALTRARHTLQITGYTHSLNNKLSPGLSFIAESLEPKYVDKQAGTEAVQILSKDWSYRFRQVIADKNALFEPIIEQYKLSVTHLNNFIDIVDAGPSYFLMHNLLRFPEAPTPSAAYGDAVHKTLQWLHMEFRKHGKLPTTKQLEKCFIKMLATKHLRPSDYRKLEHRGAEALKLYMQQRGKDLSASDLVERGFNNEGVIINNARLSGKIDKLHFINSNHAVVTDYKTGKPSTNWLGRDEYEKIKLHKYRQQLVFYKLLVEHSASYQKRVVVNGGMLEFVEPDEQGKMAANLELGYDMAEINRLTTLISSVWQHIVNLDFPDTGEYSKNLKGIQQFEQDLIDGKI